MYNKVVFCFKDNIMVYVFVNNVIVALYLNAHACANVYVFTTLQLAKQG